MPVRLCELGTASVPQNLDGDTLVCRELSSEDGKAQC